MYSTSSTALVVVTSVLVPLSSVFVALRFKVRRSTKAGVGQDDYTILAVQIIQYAGGAMAIFDAVAGGGGDSELDLFENLSERAKYAKVQYIGPIIFAVIVTLVKISTIIFYKRIFVVMRFHLACHVMMALTAGWFVTSIFGLIFSIKPVSKGPKSPDGPFAFNYSGFVLCMTAINMVLDVIVVCMPLSVIRTLQMSSTRKAQVSGVFLLGLFCIIAAAVRVYYLRVLNNLDNGPHNESQLNGIPRVVVTVTMWYIIEAQTSTIAACLPTLAPLFHSSQHVAFKARTLVSMPYFRPTLSKVMTKPSTVNSTLVEQRGKDDRRPREHLRSHPSPEGNIARDNSLELRVIEVA